MGRHSRVAFSKSVIQLLTLQTIWMLFALPLALQTQAAEAQAASMRSGNTRASSRMPLAAAPRPGSNTFLITSVSGQAEGGVTFSLQLPADAIENTLKVSLNGRDVSDRFRGSATTLSQSDGISAVKNVLSATVKTSSGSMASGRWRSMNLPAAKSTPSPAAANGNALRAAAVSTRANVVPATSSVCDPVAMCPPWLPPSVSFSTIAPGNWNGTTPWIAVSGVPYGQTGTAVSANYVMLAFNRQSLAFEDFEWFGAGADVTSYIQKFTPNDLVVVGTTSVTQIVNSGLDTSYIGGVNLDAIAYFPNSYMVIGYGGQASDTAYQSFAANGATATGLLDEDVNGNYNFQSSGVVEYAIEPAPGTGNSPQIELKIPPNLSFNGETEQVLVASLDSPVQNGLWLVLMDRAGLMSTSPSLVQSCQYQNPGPNNTYVFVGCGTLYGVGPGNSDIDGQWTALGAALDAVTPDQLVFLVSVGQVGTTDLATTVESATTNPTLSGFSQFAGSQQGVGGLVGVGGTPMAIAGPTFTNQDTYALLGFSGAGNALTGGAAEASSVIPSQLGVLHGTLQRDGNGNYRPAQSSQEQQGLFDAKGGLNDSDFTLAITSYQQPVPWPSNSPSVLLQGASSIQGQQAAFRFVSHWLLAGFYMKGIQGPHQDDIHFFFTGSTNTSIDYHTMDPANLQFPGQGSWESFGCSPSTGTNCTFQAPGDSAPSSFTSSDFTAVADQLSTEVIYLTNALQYLVTGSTNLKDVMASGNANTGLALTAAANTVLGSGMANLNSQAIAAKQVKFSWQSLVSTLSGIAELAANVASGGALTPVFATLNEAEKLDITRAVAVANVVGSALSAVSDGAQIKTATSTISSSPQPFAPITATVGELASVDLQSPLLSGFDVLTDNITSDWGRLSAIAPNVVNVNDPAFFAPSQVQEANAVNALTTSATRSFFFSLLPTVYNLHFWTGVAQAAAAPTNTFQPTVGSYITYANDPTCYAFYLSPNTKKQTLGTLSPYQGVTTPTLGGVMGNFDFDSGYNDFWVVDGTVAKPGTVGTNIAVMDATLATSLFSPTALGTPMVQFFSYVGPMESVTFDASQGLISGFQDYGICDASSPQYPSASPSGPGPTTIETTTALISPMSGVLGHDAVITAQVMAGSNPVATGKVYISVDGTVSGSPTVGADGTASVTIPGGLALGNHQIQADSAPGVGFYPSSAQPATFTVYSESPDISLALSGSSMNASYNAASAPLSLQINSIAGLTGNVALSCTGLPAGLACTFNSQSPSLPANGQVSATVQIGPSSAAQTAVALLFLPLLGLGLPLRRRKSLLRMTMTMTILAASFAMASLTGCGGTSAANPAKNRVTGIVPIVVTAQIGAVARSVNLNVNIQ